MSLFFESYHNLGLLNVGHSDGFGTTLIGAEETFQACVRSIDSVWFTVERLDQPSTLRLQAGHGHGLTGDNLVGIFRRGRPHCDLTAIDIDVIPRNGRCHVMSIWKASTW